MVNYLVNLVDLAPSLRLPNDRVYYFFFFRLILLLFGLNFYCYNIKISRILVTEAIKITKFCCFM